MVENVVNRTPIANNWPILTLHYASKGIHFVSRVLASACTKGVKKAWVSELLVR
jgi:hypothetical protein